MTFKSLSMLRGQVLSRFIGSVKNNPYDFIYFLFYACCLTTFTVLLVNPDSALKFFILCALLAFFVLKPVRQRFLQRVGA